MTIVEEWLAPYLPFRNTEAFVSEVGDGTQNPEVEEDADAFFQSLLGPVDEHNLTTQLWTTHFTDPAALAEGARVSPEAAIAFRLQRLHPTEQVPPGDAATLAESYFKAGRHREGEVAAAVAYLGGDRAVSTLVYLAGAAVRANRTDAAESLLEEAKGFYPTHNEVAFCEAVLWVARGELTRAQAGLRKLTAARPEHRPAWKLLLNVLFLAKNEVEGVTVGKEATRLHPRDPGLWEQLASLYDALGRLAPAAQSLRRALASAQQSVGLEKNLSLRLNLKLASLEERRGQPEEALAIYRTLLSSGHPAPAAYLNAASCLKKLGKADDAVTLLREGLRAHPDQPDLVTNLGEILFEVGRDQEAFVLLQQGAELAPERTGNLILMAVLCLRNRQYDDVLRLASHVAQVDPERCVEALVLIGDAYRFQGADEAALETYRAALSRAPDSPDISQRVSALEEKNAPTH